MLCKNKTTLVLLRLLLVSVTAAASSVAAAASSDGGEIIRKLIHVEVVNMLPPGHSFSIHCKSKDDDLGNHIIGPNQRYGFQFRVNFFGTTLFFCEVKTEYGQGVYEIFSHRRDEHRCSRCVWGVTQVGVYGYSKGSNAAPDIYFKWK